MKYKVIKDHGLLQKGDMLEFDSDAEAYVFEENSNECSRFVMVDDVTADVWCEEEILEAIEERSDSLKIENTLELIDILLKQYESDMQEVSEKYENGAMQPCVKVEAETVYFNLTKVLNKIREELTHE